MQELRLVGVHQDGRYILLAAPDGTRYRVAITDELRVAARHRGTGEATAAIEPMSARDIQALIRSGVGVVEAADRSGWALSKVETFAAPVLAERAHIAGMAARTRLRRTDGGESERLETRVDRRLAGRGVEPGSALWDAGRGASGEWQVFCDFVAGGRQRRAAWSFDAPTGALHPVDDEARWLAGDDDQGSRPQPHRLTGERVFDVEVDGGLAEPGAQSAPLVSAVEAAQLDRTDALMTAIRAHSHAGDRRGRRRPSPRPALSPDVPGVVADASDAALADADELTFAELDVVPADAGDLGPDAEEAAGPATPTTAAPAAAPEAARAPGHPVPACGAKAPAAEPGASEARAAVSDGDDETGEVAPADFPDCDEIPPPARGTHPLDVEHGAATTAPDTAAQEAEAFGAGLATSEPTASGSPTSAPEAHPGSAPEPAPTAPKPAAAPATPAPKSAPPTSAPPASGSRRKGRVGVPNWNDVMFGPAKDTQD